MTFDSSKAQEESSALMLTTIYLIGKDSMAKHGFHYDKVEKGFL